MSLFDGCFLNVEVDLFQPLLYIKAWAGFSNPWEVTMADDLGFWVVCTKTLQKLYHATILGFRASVGWSAVGIDAALVTDTNAVGVVMLGVSANHLLGTARIDGAILRNVIVIADGLETTSLVAGFKVFHREIAVGLGGRTMNND